MDQPPNIDAVTAGASAPEDQPLPVPAAGPVPPADKPADPTIRSRMRFVLLVLIGGPYLLFMGWCLFLLSVLPSPSGAFESLIAIGSLTALVGTVILVVIALFATQRIFKKKPISGSVRALSMLRVGAVLLPGIVLGALVPLIISGEPKLPLEITDPAGDVQLVAPLSVTFSVETAIEILARRNLRPLSIDWDYTNDGTVDITTVVPTATARYLRAGIVEARAVITLTDGSNRIVYKRLSIPEEVFSVQPFVPLVDEPVIFSVAHLVGTTTGDDGKPRSDLKEVQWDFDDDGIPEETTIEPEISYTFVRTGPVRVSATVLRQSQGQQTYAREITISDPPPLPFEVSMMPWPENLTGPAPFTAKFAVETDEPLRLVKWNFGDDTREVEELETGHTFQRVGDYLVTAEVRSVSGDIARLSRVVRATPQLQLPDLSFNGTPDVEPRTWTVTGEVPLVLDLTPRTSRQYITFSWEAPDATLVGSTENRLQATYRRPGTYTATLFAQDLDGRAMRLPLQVVVKSPEPNVVLLLRPQTGPAPLEVLFDASQTDIPDKEISSFEWLFGDEGEDAAPLPAGPIVSHVYTTPKTYTARVAAITVDGQRYEKTATVGVTQPLLDACFTPSRVQLSGPGGVSFDMSCTSGNPVRVEWDFGDGSQSDLRNPDHEFLESGTYTVRLTVWQQTTSDTHAVQITVGE